MCGLWLYVPFWVSSYIRKTAQIPVLENIKEGEKCVPNSTFPIKFIDIRLVHVFESQTEPEQRF